MIAQQHPPVEHWRRVLAVLESTYADAVDGRSTLAPHEVARLEGMIAAYQRIIRDATP